MERRCLMFMLVVVPIATQTVAARAGISTKCSDPGCVLSKISLPSPNITGIASDGSRLWVAERKLDVIYEVELESGKVVSTIQSPGFRPVGLAHDGKDLWVADLQFAKAFRISLDTGTVTHEIPVPGSYPQGLAHDGNSLWLADRKEGKVFKVSTTDGTIIQDFALPTKGITGLAWHDSWLWAAGRLDDEIYQVDPVEGLVVNVLKSPGPHPWGLAFEGSTLLSADYQTGEVSRISLTPGSDPWTRSDPKEYELTYTIDVFNYGEAPLSTVDVWMAIPDNRPNQEVLDGPVFHRTPDNKVSTSTGQKYVQWVFSKLKAPGKLGIVTDYKVRLYQADWFIDPRTVTQKVSKKIKQVYLQDTEKYLVEHPYIKKVVTAVVGDEKNPYWKARRLYEWEIEKLEYKLAGGHENAPQVLKRGNGSCSEYTFSYIALCRAAGVPARYVGSLVVRKDDASTDDVFHRWAEVYLHPYGWIPVDVNHGDKPDGRGRALGFGHLTNNLLVTTEESVVSENKLGWGYNSASSWTFKGSAKVYEEPIAEWRPLPSSD